MTERLLADCHAIVEKFTSRTIVLVLGLRSQQLGPLKSFDGDVIKDDSVIIFGDSIFAIVVASNCQVWSSNSWPTACFSDS